jgi:hypothetical protein
MIGLFIDHDGVSTNVPSARFGNISMLPNPKATIEQPTGYRGESYVIDMHSRTGFSGSPVYVYRTFGSDLTSVWGTEFNDLEITNLDEVIARVMNHGRGGRMRGRIHSNNLFNLLGIHWGQFPEKWELRDKSKLEESAKRDLIIKGAYVEGMSGMTCVIPAWQIMEVLNMPVLRDLRAPDIEAAKRENLSRLKPKPESVPASDKPAGDANPNHLEDFTRLVDVAARKRPQGD